MPARPRFARQTELIVAAVLALGLLAVGGGALYFMATLRPAHADAASIPSQLDTTSDVDAAAIAAAREQVRTAMVAGNIPGLAVAVSRGSARVWAESFGYADLASKAPVTSATRFRIGAVSKTLTAAAAGLLRDQGALDLDAPVQQHVASYPVKAWPVHARHLMTDSGGVHHLRGAADVFPSGSCATTGDALRLFRDEPLAFEPGTRYRFSIYGWILLGAVVEGAAREPFAAFMTRQIFEPLGMTRTALEEPGLDSRATGYFPRTAANPAYGLQDAPDADYSCLGGAGQYMSNAGDLARFAAALTGPGFLRADTLRLLQEPARLATGAPTGFAPGWKVQDVFLSGRQVRALVQRGTPMGGTAVLLLLPGDGVAVALTSNVSYATGLDALAPQVAAAFMR